MMLRTREPLKIQLGRESLSFPGVPGVRLSLTVTDRHSRGSKPNRSTQNSWVMMVMVQKSWTFLHKLIKDASNCWQTESIPTILPCYTKPSIHPVRALAKNQHQYWLRQEFWSSGSNSILFNACRKTPCKETNFLGAWLIVNTLTASWAISPLLRIT